MNLQVYQQMIEELESDCRVLKPEMNETREGAMQIIGLFERVGNIRKELRGLLIETTASEKEALEQMVVRVRQVKANLDDLVK